jgi:hypothetical protein
MLEFFRAVGWKSILRRNWPLALMVLALLAWSAFGAPALLRTSLAALTDYQAPYGSSNVTGETGAALSQHIVIVVISGLRLDASYQMTNLNGLRQQGADRVAETGLPSYSLPAWATIGTAAWPEQHGQTTGLNVRAIQLDSIFSAATRGRLTNAVAGSARWQKLYAGQINAVPGDQSSEALIESPNVARAHDDVAETSALSLLHSSQPNLLVVQFSELERAGQQFGTPSPAYTDALQIIDIRLGRLLAAIDLHATTVLVTADHGLVERGGYGGSEDAVLQVPLVVAGQAVKPGKYDPGMQTDIAPTIAVLLGTSMPRDSQGDVLFDMLDMGDGAKAKRAVDWAEQAIERFTQISKLIGIGSIDHPQLAQARLALAQSDYQAAFMAAQSEVRTTRDLVFALREGRIQQERLLRTPGLFALLLPFGLYAWWITKRQWRLKEPLLGAVVYFVAFYALFFASGNSLSLSTFNSSSEIVASLSTFVLDASIALLVAAVSIGLFSSGMSYRQTALAALNAGIFIAAALWVQIAIFYWLYDFTWSWFVPDVTRIFVYYLAVAQSGGFMPSNLPVPFIVLLPLVAVGTRSILIRLSHQFAAAH